MISLKLRRSAWLIFLVGVALSALAYVAVMEIGTARKAADFEQKAIDRLAAVQRRISVESSVVKTIVANFAIRPDTSRVDFDRLIQITERGGGEAAHQALEWIPRVQHSERQNYEAAARAEGFDGFSFRERTKDGNMVRASDRADYFPVYYVYPFVPNKGAFGFDLGSNETRLAALELARDTGEMVASARINLVQASSDAAGVLIFAPVYAGGNKMSNVRQRRDRLIGFALGVFRISGLVSGSISSADNDAAIAKPGGIDLYLYDLSETENEKLMYVHHSRTRTDKAPLLDRKAALEGLHNEIKMNVGSRSWSIVARAVNPDVEFFWRGYAWGAAFAVGLISFLLSIYISTISNRSTEVQVLVDQRTEELREVTRLARDNEARVGAIVDTVADGIITIDEFGKIETVNPAAENIFGYVGNELVGQNVRILMPPPYSVEHDGYLEHYRDTGIARIFGKGRELEGLRKDGTTFSLELVINEMILGDTRMFTGVTRDITERKRAEKMKSEFVSTVSHELRTPLTSIKGSLGLLRSGVAGNLPDKMTSMLDIAYNNSERLVLLINDILDIEKIEAGKMDFRRETVDLSTLIHQAVTENVGYAEAHSVTFRITDNLPDARISGDGSRLMQVLNNLLSNAAKFSNEDTDVDISLRRADAGYRISVTDRGKGIAEEYREQLFEKFSQADSSDTRQIGGTGLGLSISKAIIERHGGEIGFVSVAGQGSTFFFELPRQLQHSAFESAKGGTRILVCEDEPDIAVVISGMLQQAGYSVQIATTAAEAKEALAKGDFAAMTLDIQLPDQDGISLLKELRQDTATAKIPVVVVSASSIDSLDEFDGDAFGLVDWIEKPIPAGQLIDAVALGVRGARNARPHVLHVEDDPDVVSVLQAIAEDFCDIDSATTLAGAKALLAREVYDLVILDLMLPDGAGEDLLPLLRGNGNVSTPVIIFSGREVSHEMAQKIDAVLMKSQTSNEELLETVRFAIGPKLKPEDSRPV